MKIGVIGTDSSHAIAFCTRLIEKGHYIFAYRGGSTIELSKARIESISEQLHDRGVPFVDSLHELANICDAYIIASVDASQHLAQFEELLASRKPIFIDKPLAHTFEQAASIIELAKQHDLPLMSCSALRFAKEVQLAKVEKSIDAVDVVVPLPMLEHLDYFYYGIHALEIISTLKGVAIQDIAVTFNEEQHFITLTFIDRTVSTIRGYLQHRQSFQFVTHTKQSSKWYEIAEGDFQFYDHLVDAMEQFFITKKSPIAEMESLQIIRLLEQITNLARRNH